MPTLPSRNYAAIRVTEGSASIPFDAERKDAIVAACSAAFETERVESFIAYMEHIGCDHVPWGVSSRRRLPTPAVRRAGLESVASRASDLARDIAALDGIIGADWFAVHHALLDRCDTALHEVEGHLAALSSACEAAQRAIDTPSKNHTSPIAYASDSVASGYVHVFKAMPTVTSDASGESPSSIFAKVLAECVSQWSERAIAWSTVRNHAANSVRLLRQRIRQHPNLFDLV